MKNFIFAPGNEKGCVFQRYDSQCFLTNNKNNVMHKFKLF